MWIFPAIDLREGRCVRLRQGDYAQETVFDTDPVAVAQRWLDQGATRLHVVDLDGAKAGHPVNGPVIRAIVSVCAARGVPVQLGGGIRSEAHLEEVFSWGVARVVLGTKALQDPAWAKQMARRFPQQIVLGLDAKEGKVATHGWLEVSHTTAAELAQQCADWPLAAIVFTDIARDGMMAGPNLAPLLQLQAAVPQLPVIASGGVTTLDDVRALLAHRVPGCIIGRSLYEGRITLPEVLAVVAANGNSAGR